MSGTNPFSGPGLSRRAFSRLGSSALVASWFVGHGREAFGAPVRQGAVTRGTARNAILVSLAGAPSHVDTFDLKEGAWTPSSFAPTPYLDGALRFPQGLLPRLAEHVGELAFVRSCRSWALVHGLAQTWAEIARSPSSALGAIAPHVGAVVALETEAGRDGRRDLLPAFVALGATPPAGAGYLRSTNGPFVLSPRPGGLPFLAPDGGEARFLRRWEDRVALEEAARAGGSAAPDGVSDYAGFQEQARALIESREVGALFSFTEDELTPFGRTDLGAACLVAAKLLAGRRGTRFVQLTLEGWDHHTSIYAPNGLPAVAATLDPALATLLERLAATAGEAPGRTLLDETLVLVSGEFGRTPGPLNGQAGRDHFLRYTALLAGGGVRGGRVIGRTDALGDGLLDSGWGADRDVRPEDLAATLYSALGIDWTTVRKDDPLGRGFEYVPYARDGVYRPLDELWA